jgi:hypothetical protein
VLFVVDDDHRQLLVTLPRAAQQRQQHLEAVTLDDLRLDRFQRAHPLLQR